VPDPWCGWRLISRHRPPCGADGPEKPAEANRDASDEEPHGCHPLGAAAARDEDERPLAPFESAIGVDTASGLYVDAELRAYEFPEPLPIPRSASVGVTTTASPESCTPHNRHAVTGFQVCHGMVAAAADATASAPTVNTTRLR